MKFIASAKFEWQEDSYGCLDLTIAGVLIGWVAYREIDTEIYYAICDKEEQLATQSYKTLDEAKVALLKHFGIEVTE